MTMPENPLDDDVIGMARSQPAKPKTAVTTKPPPHQARDVGFSYKMVPMPPDLWTKVNATHTEAGKTASAGLQSVVDKHAVDGWEFFRIDEFHTSSPHGCLGIMLPMEPAKHVHYVVTFRRSK